MHATAAFEPLQVYRGKARAKRLDGVLPEISCEMAEIAPRWFGAAFPSDVETRFGVCELTQSGVTAVAVGDHLCAQGKVDKADFSVCLPKDALGTMLARAGLGLDDSKIDPFVQAMALEHVFGPMIGALEFACDVAVSLNRVTSVPCSAVKGLPLQLGLGPNEQITVFIAMSPVNLKRLLPLPRKLDVAAMAAKTPLQVFLAAGAMWITMAQLSEWKIGDVILFSVGKAPLDAMLCIAGGAVAQVRAEGDALVLLTPFQRPLTPKHERISPMAQADLEGDARPKSISQRTLDEVMLMVSFDLGQRQMTLDELSGMTVGTVFEIGNLAEDHAKIRVNGTLIGSARLVQIEERLGVQIVALQPTNA